MIARLFERTSERAHYAGLLAALGLGYLAIAVLRLLAPFVAKPRSKDLALYVHAPLGSAGYTRRFEVLFPFLDREGVRYDVMTHFDDPYVNAAYDGPRRRQYVLYARILWKRIGQVWRARHYKAVFIQRGLFPLYPDAKTPHLEKLMRRLADNVTIDFWDPVHLTQPELTFASFRYADKISMVNQALFDCYARSHPHPRLLPIPIDVARAVKKTDYRLGRPIQLFYTGSEGNVRLNLEPLLPVLVDLAREFELELVVVGPYAPRAAGLNVRHIPWAKETYERQVADADLGLFPYFGSAERNRWRVASKTLDYLAAGLPFVGVTEGLPAGVDPREHMIAVHSTEEWPGRLREALRSQELRESAGRNGRALIERCFSLEKSYEDFKRIAFERVGPS